MPRARKSDIFLLALNNYIWGTGFVAIKYAQEQMGPVVLNLWSLGLSIPILMPFAYAEYRRKKTSSRPLGRRQYVDYFVMGILGLTGMTLLYNLGARLSLGGQWRSDRNVDSYSDRNHRRYRPRRKNDVGEGGEFGYRRRRGPDHF